MRKSRWVLSAKDAFILLMMGALGTGTSGYATSGLIGGQGNLDDLYAAFVDYPSGALTAINGLPLTGNIYSVAVNSFGNGILVGNAGFGVTTPYATFVSSNGALTPIPVPPPTIVITNAAINNAGKALIAGTDGANKGYVFSVAADGTLTPISLQIPLDFLPQQIALALNDADVGLIGGEGNEYAYASYISPQGEEKTLLVDNINGAINSVALNSKGNGVIGGWYTPGGVSTPYGALTSSSGTITTLLNPLPNGAVLKAVAINEAGLSLVGGQDGIGKAFAGYADTSGNVTALFPTPFIGNIASVALNNSGVGLLGGVNSTTGANLLYAAFVQPNGSIQSLITSPPSGHINFVAINDQGVGLFGGQINGNQGYAALVAPNGALTFLDVTSLTTVNSGGLIQASNVTNSVVPQSIGSLNSVAYTQLASSSALQTRFIEQNQIWRQSTGKESLAQNLEPYAEYIAASDPQLAFIAKRNPKKKETPSMSKNTFWTAPFGNFVHLEAQETMPSLTNTVGGILLAFDHQESNFMIGGALGYAFNSLHYGESLGHGKIQEEMACFYGAYYQKHFWLEGALWEGLYQFSNVRHATSLVTAKAFTRGGILSPHFEMASPWSMDSKERYLVEPFVLVDWINSWQQSFTETGASGFNLVMPSIYGSLLQSEVGVRFYERFPYEWGDFYLTEKISYVNQAPFFSSSETTAFVSSASTFPVAVASTNVENLGSIQVVSSFHPANPSYPFGGLVLQATGNGSYQSYFVSVFTGIDF